MASWGTLPGAYIAGVGWGGGMIVGGKPLPLMESVVTDYSRHLDMVCDPFAGAGTTGVACIRLGRRFVGWERDPKTFEIARQRLESTREQLGLPRMETSRAEQEEMDV